MFKIFLKTRTSSAVSAAAIPKRYMPSLLSPRHGMDMESEPVWTQGRNYLMKETGMVDAKLELNSLIKQTNLGVALALLNPQRKNISPFSVYIDDS